MEEHLNQRVGHYVATVFHGETVRAFVPPPLPPIPPVQLTGMLRLLEEANQAVGRLDGLASILPDSALFIYTYIRKEAVLSSQIEGTQSSLSDLLLFEMHDAPGVPVADVKETSNYVAAMSHGLTRLREGFPLSLRLIREIHAILLAEGRGSNKEPGEFRRSQNWIGGSRPGNATFVPPPPEQVLPCMGDLEKFLREERADLPVLVRAALMHVQFETIHPFLDGNGRLGRLLITFLLCSTGSLRDPLLYLSLYLKENRETYYDLLTKVRKNGDWETWVEFFLTGVRDTARQAISTAQEIHTLFEEDGKRIQALGRAARSAGRVYHHAQQNPVISIAKAAQESGLTFPTVSDAVAQLEQIGILKEITGRQRGRLYVYSAYLSILQEGTEPLPR
jgi:Fic family protein